MIFVVTECNQCPFMNVPGGERVCNIADPKLRPIPDGEKRPEWCGLRAGQKTVRDFPGGQASAVVTACEECPFMSVLEGRRACNVATPSQRPIPEEDERPFWCKLRKEQIIVRDFK